MKMQLTSHSPLAITTDLLVVVFSSLKPKLPLQLDKLDKALGGHLKRLIKSKELQDKSPSQLLLHTFNQIPAKKILLVGLGSKKPSTLSHYRDAMGDAIRLARRHRCSDMTWVLDTDHGDLVPADLVQVLSEGATMGSYRYLDYKKDDQDDTLPDVKTLSLLVEGTIKAPLKRALQVGLAIGSSVNQARDLANRPSNDLTPEDVVTYAKKTFRTGPVSVSVIDEKKAKRLGMNALLGVGQGSVNKTYLLELRYTPQKRQKPLALVGKGVTFDTGGISIKPSNSMSEMKGDMSGAAAVIASMIAIAKLKPSRNVIALVPLAENMPSANAQRPGDVVTAMNGKTIEILNTDAEGRLILADALCYAVKQKASHIIDVATLTGACLVALGDVAIGLLGNDDAFIASFKKTADHTGEKVWQLPLYDEYLDYLKSNTADIANCYEGRYGGTCTAAKFLEQFVDKTPWIHLDIASKMTNKETKGADVKGMAGPAVRNLVSFVLAS